jgi:hypothetical protein
MAAHNAACATRNDGDGRTTAETAIDMVAADKVGDRNRREHGMRTAEAIPRA